MTQLCARVIIRIPSGTFLPAVINHHETTLETHNPPDIFLRRFAFFILCRGRAEPRFVERESESTESYSGREVDGSGHRPDRRRMAHVFDNPRCRRTDPHEDLHSRWTVVQTGRWHFRAEAKGPTRPQFQH